MTEPTSSDLIKIPESEESAKTTTLIERMTELIALQQAQLSSMQKQQSLPMIAPALETPMHPNPIFVKLDGTNYSLWSQVVRMYVKSRDKLRHITGNPTPPMPSDVLYPKWDIDDTVVKGWLINSLSADLFGQFPRYPTAKEVWDALATTFYDGNDAAQVFDLNKRVTRLKQSGRSVEEYYNELQGLWQEINFRRPNPMIYAEDIEKFNAFVQETRVYTFLDGLDDRLDNERAIILQMTPFPTIEQAFARVRREATRQGIMLKGGDGMTQISAAMISTGHKQTEVNLTLNRNFSSIDRSKLKCTHCGQTRHIKEQCFQIIGYPDWYKDRKKNKPNMSGKARAAVATAQFNSVGPMEEVQTEPTHFFYGPDGSRIKTQSEPESTSWPKSNRIQQQYWTICSTRLRD